MNLMDVLLLIGVAAGVAVGLFQGLLSQLITLVVLYLSAVLATAYHTNVADWILSLVSTSGQSAQALAFVLILFVTFALLMLVTRDYRKAKLPLLKHLDQVGGMAVGFVTTCVAISLLIAVAHFVVAQPTSWHQAGKPVLASFPGGSIRGLISAGLRGSTLANLFDQVLPYIIMTIRPWTSVEILQVF